MTIDSPVATAFVAAPDNWSRDGAPIRAIVIHMAEGGGTVSWLTRNDGNSSHYVVEYSGRCVQMVAESRAAGSLNPRVTRTTNDAFYTYLGETIRYGIMALKTALGTGISDPNRFVIAIEVEGWASSGPNAAQRATLKKLVNDIRRRRGALTCLGHRDQQDEKPCPGHRIPWVDYGGHGKRVAYVPPATPPPPATSEDIVNSYPVPKVPSIGTVAAGTWLYTSSALEPAATNIQVDPGRDLPYLGQPTATYRIVEYVDASGVHSGKTMFVKATELTNIRAIADDTPYKAADVSKAYNDGLTAAGTAVAAVPRR